MSANPLTQPLPWDLVAADYAVEIVPHFERYARDALAALALAPGAAVVDVATGPGTFALVAAAQGARVTAIDFAPRMVAALDARAAAAGMTITATVGDGMALPYADAQFDAGASMFGLFMFADRARGFRELRRVVRPGGKVCVTSWLPFDHAPMLATVMAALRARMPGLPFGQGEAPLGDRAEVAREMTEAGFASVEVTRLEHAAPFTGDVDALWGSLTRTLAPLVLLARSLGERWPAIGAQILDDLRATFGASPPSMAMPAWLGVGVA